MSKPAFPRSFSSPVEEGMSLRDYMAAKAMQSLVGRQAWSEEMETIALRAYKMADYMLAERDK